MARPRLVADDVVLDAAHRLLVKLGPARLTLAAVGAEVGLAAPTLIQRFGSKHALFVAAAARSPVLIRRAAEQAESSATSPLTSLRDFLTAVAHPKHRDALRVDASDPDFRRHALAQSAAIVDTCTGFYRAAQASGELLPRTDVPALARHTLVCVTGAAQVWSIDPVGPFAGFLAGQLDQLLEAHRARGTVDEGNDL